MADEILKFTKLTFLIHFILGVVFTVLYWIPEVTAPLFGITTTPMLTSSSMTVAALTLALTVSSLLGFLAKEWKQVKIVVIAEIVWLVAGFINLIINFAATPLTMNILNLIVGLVFLALFLLTFLQQEDKLKPLLK